MGRGGEDAIVRCGLLLLLLYCNHAYVRTYCRYCCCCTAAVFAAVRTLCMTNDHEHDTRIIRIPGTWYMISYE